MTFDLTSLIRPACNLLNGVAAMSSEGWNSDLFRLSTAIAEYAANDDLDGVIQMIEAAKQKFSATEHHYAALDMTSRMLLTV